MKECQHHFRKTKALKKERSDQTTPSIVDQNAISSNIYFDYKQQKNEKTT